MSTADQPTESPVAADVVIAASFTCDGLLGPLDLMLRTAQLGCTARLAPYHQVVQQLIDPASDLAAPSTAVAVVLLRVEDYFRGFEGDLAQQVATAAVLALQLTQALAAFRRRSKLPLVVGVFEPGAAAPHRAALLDATAELSAKVSALAGVTVFDPAAAAAHFSGSADERTDPLLDHLAHIPFSDGYFAALAIALARRLHAVRKTAHKVLVLDCDNTLWAGVLGEDGADGVQLTPPFEAMQRYAVTVQREGTLICLASKNDDADVVAAFAQRTDMPLRMTDVVARAVDWNPKAANIRGLARQLNLGLDAFVFVDDNPVECAQVRHELPQVVTLQLPAEAEVPAFLDNLWTFDKLTVSEEDRRRTESYKENAERDAFEHEAQDMGAFLEALQMTTEIRAPADNEWERVAQLTQKTNQFNTTTLRSSVPQLKAMVDDGHVVLIVRVTDRFGDFGLCGIAIAKPAAQALCVSNLLLSCRVLGRGVEHALVRHLASAGKAMGCDTLQVDFARSAKNEPARAFLEHVMPQATAEPTRYACAIDAALQIAHQPGGDPAAVVEARRGGDGGAAKAKPTASQTAAAAAPRWQAYQSLSCELRDSAGVVAELRRTTVATRALAAPVAPPASDLERSLLQIWHETLNFDAIGVEDPFADLGGTSLQAASLFASIRRRLGVELPITTILHATTVRDLARHIATPQAANAVPEFVTLRDGGDASLYLIHEGNGQALLYAQLAALLPLGVRVTAVQPPALPNVPLAAAGVQQLAAHYRQLILHRGERQPIFVGGLCAGGVIAQELARQLAANGKPVGGIVLFDAAVPGTPVQDGDVWGLADTRFRTKAKKIVAERGLLQALPALGRELVAHVPRAARSRLQARRQREQYERQLQALDVAVAGGAPWPADLPSLSVLQIYTALERRFRAQRLFGVPCTLIKATQGAGVDRPLASVYAPADLGWAGVVDGLRVVEAAGGHASMFQAPHVQALALQVAQAMRLAPAASTAAVMPARAAALQPAGGAVSMKL